MDRQVERIRTDISEPQMAQAIIAGWRDLFGEMPTKEQVSMILAQNNLETGHITHTKGDGFDYWQGPDWFYDAQRNKKTITQKFRAYPTIQDGVKDYLKLLSGSHYASAWQHILHPDPVAFSKALKKGGYYTADESTYTNSIKNLFNQSNKSNSYETALSGKLHNLHPVSKSNENEFTSLEGIIDSFLKSLFASGSLKQLYKRALPNHNILIKINSSDYVNAIEFSRILCLALDEELLATAYPHTDGQRVEVECQIQGPAKECFGAVQQMSQAVAETFGEATKSLGGIKISTQCLINNQSSYQPISFRTANTAYREFLLRCAQKGCHGL
jgi:hypothetical protein